VPATSPRAAARRALLDGILEAHHAAGEFVGARIALLDDDGTITEVTAGAASVDPTSGPVDPDVPWNVGSVTKTFVAVVVMQLAEEGRIDLDAGIQGFLPDLAGADRITPRMLLQHTSGLGEYLDQPAVRSDLQREWTPSELIAVAEAAGRVGEPGGAHRYSNTNYVVLGEIIEKVTGHSWADEVRTRIVEPLGLTSTGLTSTGPIGAPWSTGYRVVDGAFVDATRSADPSVGGAAGGLQSTGRDLLKFAVALAAGTLLSPESRTAMQAFVPGDDYSQFGIDHGYGLGIERYADATIAIIGHMGTGEDQSAFVGYDADHHTAAAVMTNTAIAGPQAIMAFETLSAVATAG
jgi:D-alanyl-D-alanine carboxypeptidase